MCPLCGGKLVYDRKLDFYVCDYCNAEVWPKKETASKNLLKYKCNSHIRILGMPNNKPLRKGNNKRDAIRFEVFKRDNFKCVYCGRTPKTDNNVVLELEHVVPVVDGGRYVVDNLVTSCRECNKGKGSIKLA